MRERDGRIELTAGDHSLRLDFIEQSGDAGCILRWQFADHDKEVVPADVLFHAPKNVAGGSGALEPGLRAEFYPLVEGLHDARVAAAITAAI